MTKTVPSSVELEARRQAYAAAAKLGLCETCLGLKKVFCPATTPAFDRGVQVGERWDGEAEGWRTCPACRGSGDSMQRAGDL